MHISSLKKYAKIAGLISLVIVILLATLVLGKGATSLFSKASSCGVDKVSSAQVSANSAVINWESTDISQGIVQYGINATNLTFFFFFGSSGKIHNVPLTLLTPNTVYYYVISVGKSVCDSSGQSCDTACVPWSFTTAAITPQQQIVAPILSPTLPTTPSATIAAPAPSASPSSSLSPFCSQVKENIGASSADTARWEILKQYDIDSNGFINGMDALKCTKTGK